MQALSERGSVFAGVGDEDARLLRRWHWGDRPLSTQKLAPPTNCCDVGLRLGPEMVTTTFGSRLRCVRSLRRQPDGAAAPKFSIKMMEPHRKISTSVGMLSLAR